MRFYRRADDAVLEIRNPRVRFFLLGPFYLLWLRLWKEAVILAAGVYTLVHGSALLTRVLGNFSGGIDLESAFAAIDALQAVGYGGATADAAFRQLISAVLPLSVAAFTLLATMTVLTTFLPAYLTWRFRRRGWEPLSQEPTIPDSPIYGY